MTTTSDATLSIIPANEASWDDIATIFGARGVGARCFCQHYKLQPREAFKHNPPAVRAERLKAQTNCGDSRAGTTSGLVAYLVDPEERRGAAPRRGTPAGWCAVEPRKNYPGLLRVTRVPWAGRAEDKNDASVWAVTCVFTRAGFRRRGVTYALARAALDFARARGARTLEAYPMLTTPGEDITWGELHVGGRSIFEAAGMKEVSRPTKRRVVMRVEF